VIARLSRTAAYPPNRSVGVVPLKFPAPGVYLTSSGVSAVDARIIVMAYLSVDHQIKPIKRIGIAVRGTCGNLIFC
jgi:hypothetical protein